MPRLLDRASPRNPLQLNMDVKPLAFLNTLRHYKKS